MVFYIIIVLILTLVVLLLFTKINIVIEFNKDGNNDHLVLSFFAYKGLIRHKYEIPKIGTKKKGIFFRGVKEKGKNEKDSEKKKGFIKYSSIIEKVKKVKSFYEKYDDILKKALEYLKPRFKINKLDLHTVIGTGNASQTAILTGMAWTVVGILLSALHNFIGIKENHIEIKPDFAVKKLKIDLYCIFKVKIAHIIVVGFIILTYLIRSKIGSVNVKRSITG